MEAPLNSDIEIKMEFSFGDAYKDGPLTLGSAQKKAVPMIFLQQMTVNWFMKI